MKVRAAEGPLERCGVVMVLKFPSGCGYGAEAEAEVEVDKSFGECSSMGLCAR